MHFVFFSNLSYWNVQLQKNFYRMLFYYSKIFYIPIPRRKTNKFHLKQKVKLKMLDAAFLPQRTINNWQKLVGVCNLNKIWKIASHHSLIIHMTWTHHKKETYLTEGNEYVKERNEMKKKLVWKCPFRLNYIPINRN